MTKPRNALAKSLPASEWEKQKLLEMMAYETGEGKDTGVSV